VVPRIWGSAFRIRNEIGLASAIPTCLRSRLRLRHRGEEIQARKVSKVQLLPLLSTVPYRQDFLRHCRKEAELREGKITKVARSWGKEDLVPLITPFGLHRQRANGRTRWRGVNLPANSSVVKKPRSTTRRSRRSFNGIAWQRG
jgi:hypothetical protein